MDQWYNVRQCAVGLGSIAYSAERDWWDFDAEIIRRHITVNKMC